MHHKPVPKIIFASKLQGFKALADLIAETPGVQPIRIECFGAPSIFKTFLESSSWNREPVHLWVLPLPRWESLDRNMSLYLAQTLIERGVAPTKIALVPCELDDPYAADAPYMDEVLDTNVRMSVCGLIDGPSSNGNEAECLRARHGVAAALIQFLCETRNGPWRSPALSSMTPQIFSKIVTQSLNHS